MAESLQRSFNLYPVLLQRYNRPRIERALKFINKNEERERSKLENPRPVFIWKVRFKK